MLEMRASSEENRTLITWPYAVILMHNIASD